VNRATLPNARPVGSRPASPYRFTFAHGIVADDCQHARVDHVAGGLELPAEEWRELDGKRAEYIGAGKFRVGPVVVTVQGAFDHRPNRRTGPYGTEILWMPLARTA
jgi:hypothetical protein